MKKRKIFNMKKKKRFNKKLIICFIIFIFIVSIFAFNTKLIVRKYEIQSDKIDSNIRIALVTDLHSCYYGENQKELVDCIDKEKPDLILLAGDIADDQLPYDNTIKFLTGVSNKYPCYYVSGNHEYWTREIDKVKQIFRDHEVRVLEGENQEININNQMINICGVDDFEIGEQAYDLQLENTTKDRDNSLYTILLAHRPEQIKRHIKYDYDLVLSGHAHGGQWRIPGIINGVYAPNQGILPKIAGGKYEYEKTTLIVSRGLARESTRVPRIFNPPELVIIDVMPDIISN